MVRDVTTAAVRPKRAIRAAPDGLSHLTAQPLRFGEELVEVANQRRDRAVVVGGLWHVYVQFMQAALPDNGLVTRSERNRGGSGLPAEALAQAGLPRRSLAQAGLPRRSLAQAGLPRRSLAQAGYH
jgi:hypothetical protein